MLSDEKEWESNIRTIKNAVFCDFICLLTVLYYKNNLDKSEGDFVYVLTRFEFLFEFFFFCIF